LEELGCEESIGDELLVRFITVLLLLLSR